MLPSAVQHSQFSSNCQCSPVMLNQCYAYLPTDEDSELSDDLGHIGILDGDSTSSLAGQSDVVIGAGRPPVPARLARKIQSGAFVEMANLLPDGVGTTWRKDGRTSKRSRRSLTILEWLQCFSTYVSVLARKHPNRVPDLMAYQTLIIDASLEFRGDSWAGYDRRFRQDAASTPHTPWSRMDSALWSLAFTGRARTSRCCYCFSLTHRSPDCDLSPDLPTQLNQSSRKICFRWNESPNPQCTFPNCKFEHICYICSRDPANTDLSHKAINCPQHPLAATRPIQSLFPANDPHRLPTPRRR